MRTLGWMSIGLGLLVVGAAPCRADDQAEAVKVVDRAVKAMGGEARLAKFHGATVKGQGTINFGGEAKVVEDDIALFPDQYRFDLSLDIAGTKFQQLMVINRDKGWIHVEGKPQEMDKEMLGAFKDYMYAMWVAANPLELKAKGYKLSPVGEIKVSGRLAVGILASCKGRRDVNLYFDKETGLPVKTEINAPAIEGGAEVQQEYIFTDHKEFDGIKLYTKILWNKDGKKYVEREVSEFKPLEKADDSHFARP